MKVDRIQQIYDLLKKKHNLSLNYLCETFDVSK
ncbi:MAG: DeoR family transcriptional regulator, partial [Selenomonas sp.]|nr:DeoR family transcriptional regulator [Selenomonas sp.]